jgi:hypothetical protein
MTSNWLIRSTMCHFTDKTLKGGYGRRLERLEWDEALKAPNSFDIEYSVGIHVPAFDLFCAPRPESEGR